MRFYFPELTGKKIAESKKDFVILPLLNIEGEKDNKIIGFSYLKYLDFVEDFLKKFKSDNVFLLPPIFYGLSSGNYGFHIGYKIEKEKNKKYWLDFFSIIESLKINGFKKIIILNGSENNLPLKNFNLFYDWIDIPGSSLHNWKKNIHFFLTLSVKEVKEIIKKGINKIIVPIGMIEYHQRHLPIGCDFMVAEYISELLIRKIKEGVIIAPPIYYGSNPYNPENIGHLLPGTINGNAHSSAVLILSVIESLISAGFKYIYFESGHGGNGFAFKELSIPSFFQKGWTKKGDAYVGWSGWWMLSIDGKKVLDHGGITETSLCLLINENLVEKNNLNQPLERWKYIKKFIHYREAIKNMKEYEEQAKRANKKEGERCIKKYLEFVLERFPS